MIRILSIGVAIAAVARAEPALRQGRFHTPELAKAEMDARWQEYGTREGWTARAVAIRRGILESGCGRCRSAVRPP